MITDADINDLVETTMKDMPLMPIEWYLLASCETEFEQELMSDFIRRHFTLEQIVEAGKGILDAISHNFWQ